MKRIALFLILAPILSLAACRSAEDDADFSFRGDDAMRIVRFMSDRWRERGGGNPGFDESLDEVREHLQRHGFETIGRLFFLEGPLTLRPVAWSPLEGELHRVDDGSDTLIDSYPENPTLVARYSGSTAGEGVTAPLVDVGAGVEDSDYTGKDVSGRIVLAHGRLAAVFRKAVTEHGALGVISDRLMQKEFATKYPDMVLTGSLPFSSEADVRARQSFGLKISPRLAADLRTRLAHGAVQLRVRTRTKIAAPPQRVLVAQIPGTDHAREHVVLVSHMDNNRPGANNNASGAATHAELARLLAAKIAAGIIKRPRRTITFLFGAEHEGSKMWLAEARRRGLVVFAMINADMTGEDTAQTGGVYRLERMPDPASGSPRPLDERHPEDRPSGWGFRPLEEDPPRGHYLDDLAWDIIRQQSAQTGWKVHQNPFEGGSDHDEFLAAGVPSVLSWHWVDEFLSTNLDTPDKVSVTTMRNVAAIHERLAVTLASADAEAAKNVLSLVERAAGERLAREARVRERRLALHPGDTKIAAEEARLQERWRRWYDEAMESVATLPCDGPDSSLSALIAASRRRWAAKVGSASTASHASR